ncbi:type II toxin-antitoxin system RelB family antitoxin [Ferrovum myxofaciens]|jgi:hypothetical protein|uniref:Stability determinant domain-containing protein n=1 Tax=Ferrovum myxofaciens TaxID=416213 RepID=A0A149VW81_9PROT|nr:hypothetical protein [Ferrovum myxofaciens]KXW57469.1 hypothetical protein FEMY_20040 [Ferrovum myxofaciens]MBU6994419.1 hypothetical protein [Ferrovum myxofaciens]QKE39992.1 MAG: antitoxin [Ferrovum myxofaciens]
MSVALSPLVSEFESVDQEASYVAWLRTKVELSLADKRSLIPHDEVMVEMDSIIEEAEAALRGT